MKQHLNELQVYSGIAILFVVLIHSNGYYLQNVLFLENYVGSGIILNIIDKLIHSAVPMFIFISGYKYQMNNKNEPYKKFVIKKYNNVFKPFFILSLFFIFLNTSITTLKMFFSFGTINVAIVLLRFVKDLLKIFVGYNYAVQLWYIPLYLFIVLSYPIILKYLRHDKIRMTIFILLALFWVYINNLNLHFISKYPQPFNFVYYFYLYELGNLFYKYKINVKKGFLLVLLFGLSWISISLIKDPKLSGIITDTFLVPIEVMAFYFISVTIKNSKIFNLLGKYSFHIFLFHVPFLSYISIFTQKIGFYKTGLISPILATVSILFSMGLYKILVKTKIGKYMFNVKYSGNTSNLVKNE